MENVKPNDNAKPVYDNEAEKFDSFLSIMAQLIEKYGKLVLQDLDCVA